MGKVRACATDHAGASRPADAVSKMAAWNRLGEPAGPGLRPYWRGSGRTLALVAGLSYATCEWSTELHAIRLHLVSSATPLQAGGGVSRLGPWQHWALPRHLRAGIGDLAPPEFRAIAPFDFEING